MGLRIFPIVGEALNFGGRRMATIMRVAWLPLALLMILNMATVFAYLSVIVGRSVTFADVGSFLGAQNALARLSAQGWNEHFGAMAYITGANLAMNTILVASFMAPLIRLSGLGEAPAPGVVRLAFGPDQIRYILAGLFSYLFVVLLVLAPIMGASVFSLYYVIEAMSQTMAHFPDPESLHTIEFVTLGETLAQDGSSWILNLAIPLTVVAPLALLLWLIVFFHFHPRNRPNAPARRRPIARAMVSLIAVLAVAGGVYVFVLQSIMNFINSAAAIGGEALPDISSAPTNAVLFSGVIGYLLYTYFNLRLFAYPGVAVCRKSMAPANMLKVSRGWDLIRLQIVLIVIAVMFFVVQAVVINLAFLQIILPMMINQLYSLAIVSTRLVNSGVTADWVQPVFVWAWNITRILINVFWAFFSYGVTASLYGRLYRESESP